MFRNSDGFGMGRGTLESIGEALSRRDFFIIEKSVGISRWERG